MMTIDEVRKALADIQHEVRCARSFDAWNRMLAELHDECRSHLLQSLGMIDRLAARVAETTAVHDGG